MSENRIDLAGQWKRSVGGRDIGFVDVPGSYAPLGECVLERQFDCAWRGKAGQRLFLVTEGVLATAAFSLNGRELGTAGPWATYRFEIPAGLLKPRGNVLTARVRDIQEPFGPAPGRRFDAGLVRPLWIERRAAVFLEDVAFRAEPAEDFSSAACTVAVELNGGKGGKVDVVLAERDTGRVVGKGVATAAKAAAFTVEWPRPWSPEMPNLYTLTATLHGAPSHGEPSELLTENVGIRRIEVRGRDFYLNGKRLLLKGVCRHEFTDASGYSPSLAEVRRELGMIKHAGFNYNRLVHSPQAGCVCRTAAELGLLVSEEPGTCWHDLGNEAIAAPAVEALRRTVKRDRNVPSIFAWLIYNECLPNVDYAVKTAAVCRALDPGCRLGMADSSGRHDDVKAMVKAADMTFYGINFYSFWPNDYCERMKTYTDRPLVFTEWGGAWGQGNARALKDLCDSFVIHSRQGESLRVAGCSFWAWTDYEEHSRPAPAAIDGWTIEGLTDAAGRPKTDLQALSTMCFEMGREPLVRVPRSEVLCPAPRREEAWEPLALDDLQVEQAALEEEVARIRRGYLRYAPYVTPQDPVLPAMPRFGRLLLDGIEMRCRDAAGPAAPLLLGKGCGEVVIPVGRTVRALAVLGHVALKGGYPASSVSSVYHKNAEATREVGAPAAKYEFVFDDGTEAEPLRHGLEVLRSNEICRWWTPQPRGPRTRPAVRVVVDKSYEVLRLDLWEHKFEKPRRLEAIRWRLLDADAILVLYAVSVLTA